MVVYEFNRFYARILNQTLMSAMMFASLPSRRRHNLNLACRPKEPKIRRDVTKAVYPLLVVYSRYGTPTH
jgi:hypothetical protein